MDEKPFSLVSNHRLPATSAKGLILNRLNLDVVKWIDTSESSLESIKQIGKDFNQYLDSENKVFNWESVVDFLHRLQKESGLPYKSSSILVQKYALKKLIALQPDFAGKVMAQEILNKKFKQIQPGKSNLKIESKDYLTQEELEKLIKYCMAAKKRKNRVGYIIKALFETGCRISELIHIQLSHCTSDKDFVSIEVLGKGKKLRNVFLKKTTFDDIQFFFAGKTHLFESENHKPFFRNNLYRTIHKVAQQSGLEKEVHPHTLRHSCAMHLLHKQKLSPKAVSTYLGHADVATTLNFYIHDMPNPNDVLGVTDLNI